MIQLKNAQEINKIRESCHLLSEMFDILRKQIEPGITTGELDETAYDFITKNGGKPAFLGYMGFPASLCTSVNEEVIHGIPGNRKLHEGDVVSIDCGIDFHGYFSDSAFTAAVGSVGKEVSQLLKTTEESLYLGIEQAVNKNRIHDISRAVYNHADEKGYGVVRQYTGHGVGFSQHEDPQIPNYIGRNPNPRIKPGMVLAIEPMINLGTWKVAELDDGWTVITADRSVSAHFEHTVAVYEDHTEILTRQEFPVLN